VVWGGSGVLGGEDGTGKLEEGIVLVIFDLEEGDIT